jgi:sugar/nucleoside kinase (ribokinase family)
MKKKYDVYGIGNALVDKEFEVSDDFFAHESIQKGLMTLVDGESQETLLQRLMQRFGLKKRAGGGSAANSMYAISQFGGNTYYNCKVASDEFGDFYVQELGDHNIDTNLGSARDYGTTGKCLVMVSPDAERTMLTYLGISEKLSPADLDPEAIINSQYVYLEGYLVTSPTGRQACVEARRIAEANGVKTSLTLSDPAMVQYFRGGLEEMLGDGVDLLFANDVEAKAWTGQDDIEAAIRGLGAIAKTAVVTLGSDGAAVLSKGTVTRIAATPAKAIDTNGAGDMFAGAFLYAITHGHDHAAAGRLASAAAATTVSHFGPRLSPQQHKDILKKVLG